MIGSVVLDEVPMRVVGVRFHSGKMWLVAVTDERGTVTVRSNAELSLFGDDGSMILHQPSRPGGDIQQTKNGYLWCEVPLIVHIGQ